MAEFHDWRSFFEFKHDLETLGADTVNALDHEDDPDYQRDLATGLQSFLGNVAKTWG